MARYPLGRLSRPAAPKPLSTQYKLSFKPKTWYGTPDLFDPHCVWTKDGVIYYSHFDGGINYQYILDGDTWRPYQWGGNNNIPGEDVWTANGNYYCSYYENYVNYHFKLVGNTWEVFNTEYEFSGRNVFVVKDLRTGTESTYIVIGDETYSISSNDHIRPSIVYKGSGSASSIWSDGDNIYSGLKKIYSSPEFVSYDGNWNISSITMEHMLPFGDAIYLMDNSRLVGKSFLPYSMDIPEDAGKDPFYQSRFWSDGVNIYLTYKGSVVGINYDYSYMLEPVITVEFEHDLPSVNNTVTINLYMNNSEKNVIGKSLTSVRNLNGTFKQEADIVNLSIQVDLSTVPNFNYLRVPLFNRYYFVDNIVNIRDDLWEISCHVDVLESFKDTIMSTYGLIERNEFEFNPKIIDHLRVIEQGVTTEVLTDVMTLETVLNDGVPQTMTETSPRFMLVGTFMNLEGEIT